MKALLTDSFGRTHNYLRIALTRHCNLRCFYCMPDTPDMCPTPDQMSVDEIYSLAQFFVNRGVTKIRLTGGEPLVRKDFSKIISLLSTLPVELAITTNGILLDQYIDILKEHGVSNINISLDSMQRQKLKRISRRDCLRQVLNNIDLMIGNGFQIKLNVVVVRDLNDDEIPEFTDLTRNLPIQVRFIEFMPFNGNQWNQEQCVMSGEIIRIIQNAYPGNQIKEDHTDAHSTASVYRLDNFLGTVAIIGSVSQPFCAGCNRIRLTADGKVKNCLFSTGEADLLGALRAGDDLESIVDRVIRSKEAVRAGMVTLDQMSDPVHHKKNRSMVLIGG